MESLGAERNLVAFRTVHGQQLWDVDADSSVCTPFSGCFLCCRGHRPSGRCGRWWLPEAWEAGSPPRSPGQQGRISRPAPIRPPQAGAGQPGAALALGIRQPTGDRAGPRPGWDVSLRARAVAGQGLALLWCQWGSWATDGVGEAGKGH